VDPFLDVFNGPSLDASTDRRTATTIPTQVYALFNSQFMHDMALAFADRIARAEHGPGAQIRATFLQMFQRAPSPQETVLVRAQFDKLVSCVRSLVTCPW
jgi:Protein of unknown function (DUF1553)